MAHMYNVSIWAAEVGASLGYLARSCLKKPKISWCMVQVVEHLPSLHEALDSIPNIKRINKVVLKIKKCHTPNLTRNVLKDTVLLIFTLGNF
jgi:hypothetical protein